MANTTAVQAPSKREPECRVSWPGPEEMEKGMKFKIAGDLSGLALGKTCEVTIKGTVSGFRMDKYGGSLDLQTRTVKVEKVSDAKDEDEDGERMTDMVERLQGKKK